VIHPNSLVAPLNSHIFIAPADAVNTKSASDKLSPGLFDAFHLRQRFGANGKFIVVIMFSVLV
jgi:hypothetical protein